MSNIATQFKKGHVGYRGMLGKNHLESTKEQWGKLRKGVIPWNKGKKGVSEETSKKMSIARLGKYSGEKCHLWKGGITPINQKIRTSTEYKDWRTSVFQRDNYTCQECGSHGVTLHADHIKPFAYFPELRLIIDNGRTLCVPCHKKTDTFASKAKIKYTKLTDNKN